MKKNRMIKEVSLNESTRRDKQEADEEKREAQQVMNEQVINAETGEAGISPLDLKDQYLQEGLLVLADMIAFTDT